MRLMWNSSGYYEVDVEFFRDKGLRLFKLRVKCFVL